jgi:hypothetical protein
MTEGQTSASVQLRNERILIVDLYEIQISLKYFSIYFKISLKMLFFLNETETQ